jgi:hypothetical protein
MLEGAQEMHVDCGAAYTSVPYMLHGRKHALADALLLLLLLLLHTAAVLLVRLPC